MPIVEEKDAWTITGATGHYHVYNAVSGALKGSFLYYIDAKAALDTIKRMQAQEREG